MKKILLINSNMETNPYPVPPLGLCLLQSYLESEYEVKIYDAVFDKAKNIKKVMTEIRPDFIGISIRNIDNINMSSPYFYLDDIYKKIIKPVKTISHVPVILGGSGFSIFPDEILKFFDADYGVVGEGEKTFQYLLHCIENNISINHPNIILKDRGKGKADIISNECFDLRLLKNSDIDQKINFTLYKSKGNYPIQTKRGCAHNCIYCSYPLIEGKSFRKRNPLDIANEIENVFYRLDFTTFEFVDSTFNDPPGHAEEICREIIKKKLKINLRTMGINPDNATKELFDLMLKAGFFQIDCTPDTASEKMLINFKKNFNRKKLENVANIIKEFNIPTMWFFIFGSPGENCATCDETLEFIDRRISRLDMVHSTLGLRIYPGTTLYDISIKEGIIERAQDLLKPTFYFSKEITYGEVDEKLKVFSKSHPNLVTINETTPSADMLKKAGILREKLPFREPMFRTLLRVRYENFGIRIDG